MNDELIHEHTNLGRQWQCQTRGFKYVDKARDNARQQHEKSDHQEADNNDGVHQRRLNVGFYLVFMLDNVGQAIEHIVQGAAGLAGF